MHNDETYSLWLEPTGDQRNQLQEQIERLSREHGTPLFNPHITLLGGLQKPSEILIPPLQTLASFTNPFTVSLDEVGYRQRFYQCLFIHANPSDLLTNLRNKALQLFNTTRGDYMPHLSLLYGDMSQERKQEIISDIGSSFDIHLGIKKITLVKTNGKPKGWKRIHSNFFN